MSADNIKMELKKRGWSVMGWIDPIQDTDEWRRALVNAIINFRVP
jgi:hypothetical protein